MITSQERWSDLAQIDDEALIQEVATGSSQALERLYDRHSRAVYGLALRMLSNADQAEDVVQEAFWRVWRRSSTFQSGQGRFVSWLFGITHNLCIDELRRQRVRPTNILVESEGSGLEMLPDEQQDMDALTWQAEQRRLVLCALRELPPDQRQAIELAYFGGLSQREIAEQLNDPLGTVKTRIRLGLQKIKQFLSHQGLSDDQ